MESIIFINVSISLNRNLTPNLLNLELHLNLLDKSVDVEPLTNGITKITMDEIILIKHLKTNTLVKLSQA